VRLSPQFAERLPHPGPRQSVTRPSFLAAHPASESNKKGLALGRLRCKVLQGVGSPVQCRVCSLTATHSSSDQNIAVLHMNFDPPFSPALVRLEPVQPPVEPAILPFDKNTEHKSSAPQLGDRFCLLEPSADWPALLRISSHLTSDGLILTHCITLPRRQPEARRQPALLCPVEPHSEVRAAIVVLCRCFISRLGGNRAQGMSLGRQ
jgi:hypothetical protein